MVLISAIPSHKQAGYNDIRYNSTSTLASLFPVFNHSIILISSLLGIAFCKDVEVDRYAFTSMTLGVTADNSRLEKLLEKLKAIHYAHIILVAVIITSSKDPFVSSAACSLILTVVTQLCPWWGASQTLGGYPSFSSPSSPTVTSSLATSVSNNLYFCVYTTNS